jgi:rhodanese-related sulfurtransferase
LVDVDLHRYDEAWELNATEALSRYCDQSKRTRPESIVLDLRQPADFGAWHLPDAVNVPMNSLQKGMPSPFSDSTILERQWRELEDMFQNQVGNELVELKEKQVLIVCYDGDTSRVATSVARAKGIEADSVGGGVGRLLERLVPLSTPVKSPVVAQTEAAVDLVGKVGV